MSMTRSLTAGRIAAAAVILLGMPVGGSAADELLYYVENGGVVFTNTPSRVDARAVPGLEARVRAARSGEMPATPYDRFIEQVGRVEGVDPDLIKAVAWVESAFDPRAVSPKGAMGLMQLMPATAKRYGVTDPLDAYQSLRAGARHLRDLLSEFEGNVTLALAAYNAGSGAVRRHGGVPAYRETRDYVRKVKGRLAPSARRPVRQAAATAIEVRVAADGTILLSN